MEGFKMYAMYVNEPYIVEEKDVPAFLENSKKHNGMVNDLSDKFKDEWFEFSLNENGYMSAKIDVGKVEE
ncbi:MAG: hypothetical protein NC489_39470 [Ruminococcus flavefaciens]|nr:hypothetical protein [Ruminococcus flavefaciens]